MLDIITRPIQRFLAWTEKYTKVDMLYLARGGFWLGVGQIVSSGAALLLALAFANFLPKETYGLYKYALSIASLLSIFALPGMGTALARSVARGMEGSTRAATRARVHWAVVGAGVGLVVAFYYAINGNMSLALVLLIVSVFLPFFDTFTTFSAYFLGKQDFRRNAAAIVFIQVVSTAGLIAAAVLTKNLLVILITYFGLYSLLRFICYRFVLSLLSPRAPMDAETIPYGKHLSVMGVLGIIASNIDNIALFHFLGPTQVAVYAIAIAVPDQIKTSLGSLSTLFFPKFASQDEHYIRANMGRMFLLFTVASALLVGVYLFLAPWFFSVFFPQYEGAVFMSRLFTLSLLVMAIEPAAIFLNARGMIREQYWSTTTGYLVQIGAILIFTASLGLLGVILARITTRVIGSLINLWFLYRPLRR